MAAMAELQQLQRQQRLEERVRELEAQLQVRTGAKRVGRGSEGLQGSAVGRLVLTVESSLMCSCRLPGVLLPVVLPT